MNFSSYTTFDLILFVTALIFLSLSLYAAIISLKEKEIHAVYRSLLLAFLLPAPYFLLSLLDFPSKEILSWSIIIATYSFIVLIILPIKRTGKIKIDPPKARVDERDIMFARSALVKGDGRYEEYYDRRPEKLGTDEKFRKKPGILGIGTSFYDPAMYASSDSSFYTVNQFKVASNSMLTSNKQKFDPERLTIYLKKWAKKLGVLELGITELKDYHKYSHVGRGDDYGKEIDLTHKYAIAFTVEMDYDFTRMAPYAPVVMESAQQYLNAGAIAIQIAQFIRNLGYEARAHIDGHYMVICPLVAKDAGLGEIGRMGLLMTPDHGPRARIAVITTDMEFNTDEHKNDPAVIDFCNQCKKCADVCPANAISSKDREMIGGVERWQINPDRCFSYWCTAGTDCGRCMSVCPYSRPSNFLHDVIRLGIRNNFIFRRLALYLDDYFYGKKPLSRPIPDWMKIT